LLAEVDIALDAMRADGTFQRIIRRYMPFLAD
jgi:ABC-type amino acid transport substrate-binding protein